MNAEVVSKVVEVFKNKEVADLAKTCKSKEELFNSVKQYLSDVSEDDFYTALDDMKEQSVELSLDEKELEGVAGGFLDFHYHAAK